MIVRFEPGGGCARRVGRRERVPALGPLAARTAAANVDAELADQRGAGDLGRELLGRAGLDESPPAVRAGIGEVGLVAPRTRGRVHDAIVVMWMSSSCSGYDPAGVGR